MAELETDGETGPGRPSRGRAVCDDRDQGRSEVHQMREALLVAVLAWSLAIPATPIGVAAEPAPGSQAAAATQRYIVMLEAEHGVPRDVAEILVRAGGRAMRVLPQIGLVVASGDAAFAARLGHIAGVEAVVPDEPVLADFGQSAGSETQDAPTAALAGNTSAAPFFERQWNMRAIHADEAWAAGFRGDPSVTVAILDSGIDSTHSDLDGAVDATRSASFVQDIPGVPQCSDDALIAPYVPGAPAWTDLHTHGTHVAGIVAAQGRGISGVAPDVALIAVKVANVCSLVAPSWAIAGAVHAADEGADVINLSIAITFRRSCRTEADRGDLRSQCAALMAALNRAAAYARKRGALVVAAAGNQAMDFDQAQDLTVVPADLPTVMGVSATAPINGLDPDTPTDYTNFGMSLVDVAAPGGRFAGGQDMVLSLCSNLSLLYPECRGANAYQYRAGTSFAAPHVAGVAALVDSSHDGDLDGAQLQRILETTADDLGAPGNDPFFGRGRVHAFRAASQ
jgi:lantibiotic leader peptide-processing serine protease